MAAPSRFATCTVALLLSVAALGCFDARPPHAGVVRATLPNGLRVVIVRNPLAPVVTTQMNYLAGSVEAPDGFPGTAHALEHMMFRGSPGLTATQLAYISAAMGDFSDAYTQQSVTQYIFTVAAEDLSVALEIEALRMRGVLASDEAWQQERGAIEQEVAQNLSDPQYVLYAELLEALFGGTPYARDALGSRPSFQRTTAAMLRKFHEDWYAPNNAILVVGGDVRPDAALAAIRRAFGDIPARSLPRRPDVVLRPLAARTLHLDTDTSAGLAVIGFRLPGFQDTDYAAARVLADSLQSQRGALQNLVAEGKALDAGFSFDPLPKAGFGFATLAFPRGEAPAATLSRLQAVLRATATQGIDPDLVEAAKRRVVTLAEREKTSIPGLASAWSEALAVRGRQSPEDEVRTIQRVTPADVNRVARHLDPQVAVTAILTPKPSGKAVTGRSPGGKESFTPPNTARVPLPAWAEKAVNRLAVPTSAVNPHVTMLPNGLRLIVQPQTSSRTVTIVGRVRHRPELQTPAGREGVAEVLDGLFAFGTESLDRVAYQRALDAIGADASAGRDFELQVLAEHFDRGVQLLADNQLRPALPEAAFTIVREQVGALVAGRLETAEYQAQRALRRALLPPNDPTLREATPATVLALTPADVRSYYRGAFRPDVTTIVVIGQVTVDRARAVVEKYFGGWTAAGPRPVTDLPSVPLSRPATIHVQNAIRVQDRVILAQTLGLTRVHPDYYALELGNSVLGGAFYATRLYRDLRQNAGLVYAVDSTLEMTRTRGRHVVEYGCDPENVAKARGIILQELRAMQKSPVPPDELRQAKAVLLRRIPLSEASQDDIARGLLARAVEGLPLDEPTRAGARYLALTAADVKAAFAKWIRVDDFAQISEGPHPR